MSKTRTLNLGAGEDIHEAVHNVDVVDLEGVDEVVDLDEFPWPWQDDSWLSVHARHVLEHLENPVRACKEISRILVPGGRFELRYPIGHTRFEDPTHRNYWNWNTAATLAGGRKHSHEHVAGIELRYRNLDWNVDTLHWRLYTHARLSVNGPGPWLSQIPGLYGEVVAIYQVTEGES